MRDYYAEFLLDNSPDSAPGEGAKGSKGSDPAPQVPFDPFAPSASYGFDENEQDIQGFPEHLNDEIEERIAIMIFDGRLTEDQAWAHVAAVYNAERSTEESTERMTALVTG